jgi:hypothetical protein
MSAGVLSVLAPGAKIVVLKKTEVTLCIDGFWKDKRRTTPLFPV